MYYIHLSHDYASISHSAPISIHIIPWISYYKWIIVIHVPYYYYINQYHLVNFHITNWKIHPFSIGKPSLSMGHGFHGYVNNQRVYSLYILNLSHGDARLKQLDPHQIEVVPKCSDQRWKVLAGRLCLRVTSEWPSGHPQSVMFVGL